MFDRYNSFICRICHAEFPNPDALREHRMVKHKGDMLVIKR